ncbi:hypothetical protein [Paenibacillus azoreducens]|nr:hypothetical protein [Paenibacillus azoreducens]
MKKLSKNREEKKFTYATLLFTIASVFSILLSLYFATAINFILKDINSIYKINAIRTYDVIWYFNKIKNYHFFYVLIIIISIYSFLIFLVRLFFSIIYFEKISVSIYLKDGTVFEDKFIINHNIDGGIIIGDSYLKKAENKKLIPKSNILYISFNKVDYSFGKRNEKSKIIIPNQILENELIKEWRTKTSS